MKKTLSDILNESVMSNAGYALHRVVKKDFLLIRLMWLISLLLLSALCSFLIVKTVGNYLNYEVVTKIKIVNENPSPFPTISICNLNPIDRENAQKYMLQILQKIPDKPSLELNLIAQRFHSISNFYELIKNNSDPVHLQSPLGNMILACHYNFGVKCNESDFEWFYDFYYGGCYRFNPKETIKSYKKGKLAGIHMEIDVFYNYEASWITEVGIHIFIHNKSHKISLFEGIDAPVKKTTNIALSRVFNNKIEKPFSDCTEDLEASGSKYYKILTDANYTYKQSDCMDLCFSDYAFKRCQCREGFNIKLFQGPLCKSIEEIKCLFDSLKPFNDFESNNCNCSFECHSISYPYSTFLSEFPTEPYTRMYAEAYENVDPDFIHYLSYSLLAINIYYDELQYTVIDEQRKYEWIDLLASIGGSLGLFLGSSILSFMEVIEIFIRLFGILCK
jgi:hypothetical protein